MLVALQATAGVGWVHGWFIAQGRQAVYRVESAQIAIRFALTLATNSWSSYHFKAGFLLQISLK